MGHSRRHKPPMVTTKPYKIPALVATSFALLLACHPSFSQTKDLPAGKVIERVVCLKDASQSYALYLPPDYAPDRRWPVVYAFDPGARGLRPVERFKDAAEKYGYIVKYDAIAKDFRGLRDASEFAKRADELRANREVKESLKQEQAAEQTQQRRSQEFFGMREQLKTAENRSMTMAGMKNVISDLRRKAAGKDASIDRLVARRTLGLFYVSMMEEASSHRSAKNYPEAIIDLRLAAEIRPDNPQVFFALARACALDGDKRQALEALKKAVELGFTNTDEIGGNPDFASIRNEAAYKQLIEDAKRKVDRNPK